MPRARTLEPSRSTPVMDLQISTFGIKAAHTACQLYWTGYWACLNARLVTGGAGLSSNSR